MALKRDKEQFLIILEEHKKILYKISNSYGKSEEDREDLIQEIIYQLWKSFGKYDERFKLSTWIYRIALNVAISFHRKEKKRKFLDLNEQILQLKSDEDQQEKGERLQLMHQFIQQLDKLNKALVILYLDGNSYLEIAEILGITETNVATKLSRIRKKLAAQVQPFITH